MAEPNNKQATDAKQAAADQQPQATDKKQAQATAKQKQTAKVTPEEQVAKLQAQLAEVSKQKDELEDKYLRAEAEMANMHTRFKKEQQQLLKYDGQKLAKEVLPVMDNLTRALAADGGAAAADQLKKGVEMVLANMQKALADNNVTEIEALNQPFDPTKHQAVNTVPADDEHPADTVVQVFQAGYMLKDRVLRPAMVVVAQ